MSQLIIAQNKEKDCPSLFALVSHFNRVAVWGCRAVVKNVRLEERKKIVLKIFDVCSHLFVSEVCSPDFFFLFFYFFFLFLVSHFHIIQNYMGLQALLSALSHSSIARMKKTMEVLDEKKEDIALMRQVLSQSRSFASYREKIATVQAPFVPFTGCTTKGD